MNAPIVTAIDATILPVREQELLHGFSKMNDGPKPDGFISSELLRGEGGAWRIQTTWRNLHALMAVRRSGEPPAALALLDCLGAEHSYAVFRVEQSHDA